MKIVRIDKTSPLHGQVSPGAELRRVNGHPVADEIDFRFHNSERDLRLEIADQAGVRTIALKDISCGDLGLEFEAGKILVCNNNCIFCFIHQQPKGMRRSLYVKDDDYRYSFTHGNFVSLSNLTEADFKRIITQRLSPLYISVHATDDRLRRCIFQNERLAPILPQIKRLVNHGITLHTQTVICPGINDGVHLDRTIHNLAALAPGVASLAVVPVGLTRFRRRLPGLRPFTVSESGDVIDQVEAYQRDFQKRLGTRFVFPADEFFLSAGRLIPGMAYYDDMPQFENGVGMARQFITDFNRRRRYLPQQAKRATKLAIVTGRSASSFMAEMIVPSLNQIRRLRAELVVVDNRFWGKMVTVTGLLTGADILAALTPSDADSILLPPNCLNGDDLFLDDVTLDQFTARAGRPVLTGTYNIAALVKEALKLREN